jgi:hypothetical protein
MQAELNDHRLSEYVRAIQRLADEARPAVSENWRAVMRDQDALEAQREREALDEARIFAVGIWANRPFGMSKRMMGLGRDMLLREPPEQRSAAFERLVDAACFGPSRVPRQYWNLRLVRLFIALKCADEDGCEFLRGFAATAVRITSSTFPTIPSREQHTGSNACSRCSPAVWFEPRVNLT